MLARRAITVRNISAKCSRCLSSNLATYHFAEPCKPATSHVLPAQAPRFSSLQSTNGSSARHPNHDFPHNNLVLSNAQRRTIYALSTPPGKAGVAVIRISGPDALQVWHCMVRTSSRARRAEHQKYHPTERVSNIIDSDPHLPIPWKLERCHIVDSESGELLDDGLVVFFRGPKSFTTEDVLELHIHSGRAIISSILSSLSHISLLRPAQPGEFTRRAFEGGRLDLTQVEGLKDLIDAETEVQRKTALGVAGGSAKVVFDGLRKEIIKCLALVEALIDFGEGEDIEDGVYLQARSLGQTLRDKIQRIISDNRRGEILRSGIRLAIFGPPNAGKSSLLNFLAQREAAIVTHIPGTTRDVLELSLDIGGLPVIVADTAGMRKTEDIVEAIGVKRAEETLQTSDISILVLSLPDALSPSSAHQSSDEIRVTIPSALRHLITPQTFILLNKADLLPLESAPLPSAPQQSPTFKSSAPRIMIDGWEQNTVWSVSLTSALGTQEFMDGFAHALRQRFEFLPSNATGMTDLPVSTHPRHKAHLEDALRFLDAFLNTPPEMQDVVLAAEELRYAADAVGKISGVIGVEDVLDVVFRDFCIGK
ncbi:P-loop containing nucleoside triphosphate hydrolase protein [Stereum hirsutum FP-91666 SS1]|uniref:P-loop containing nucleoside triphosphate hydrolase protein n=1 Tax=Stereum hirsutum (strain FP-91666) TaxID=721885 RepID=UPI00044495B9|nr:P-loop containing nucleoside triphosphate hydrolase protein [Stereum hirsutum FP-91666 SS1]EIM85568.1 P-loop containing nucleoside triphosphate hydrolase protein [Stereum hirsutum FP-91666 SS1]